MRSIQSRRLSGLCCPISTTRLGFGIYLAAKSARRRCICSLRLWEAANGIFGGGGGGGGGCGCGVDVNVDIDVDVDVVAVEVAVCWQASAFMLQ